MQSRQDGVFEIKPLPIIGGYGVQRFKQFSPEDAANWVIYKGTDTKREYSMYPTPGRKHINYLGFNQLVFGSEPRGIFKTIQFFYVVEGDSIYRIDTQYNRVQISGTQLQTIAGDIYFAYLVVNSIVFACFTDLQKIYVYQENTGVFYTVTDPNAPGNSMENGKLTKPGFIVAFGNRIAVSVLNSSQFFLSQINLLTPDEGTGTSTFQPNFCFTVGTVLNNGVVDVQGAPVFAQEAGIIRQMGVLNNTLYIFTDFITGVWSNYPAVFSGTNAYFPWKNNTTYNWNFGIANPKSLDIDFGYIAFLAQNSDGLLQFMVSNGGQPEKMSDDAIDVLLQNYTNKFGSNNPFLVDNSNGFLYQYENKIYYRMSGGDFVNYQVLDQEQNANSIEFNFENKRWQRCIELNGNRCRVQLHVYFNSKHLVTVTGESTIYEMSGAFYVNEVRNPAQPDPQQPDAYLMYPMRYERVTPIISEPDYAEFETEYVEIDFVFGESNLNFSLAPFDNTQFIIDEQNDTQGNTQYVIDEHADTNNEPVYMITEDSNFPTISDTTYNTLFAPHIELYLSDDGGISFQSLDVREFSRIGEYIFKMRWYQLGASRNRAYNLIAVGPYPIVVLGGVMNVRRISGGAN